MTPEHSEKLAAIEKTLAVIQVIVTTMAEDLKDTKRDIAELRKDNKAAIQRVHDRIDEERERTTVTFVSKTQFGPIEKLVYGGTVIVLAAFLGALVAFVFKR